MGIYLITAEKQPAFTMVGKAVNTWHLNVATDDVAVVNSFINTLQAFYDAIKVYLFGGGAWTIGGKVVRLDVDPNTVVAATQKLSTPTGGNPLYPPNDAFVVTWRTGAIGKSFRGRTYLGPWSGVAYNTDGTMASALQTALTTAIATLIAFQAGDPGNYFGVYSKFHDKAERAVPIITKITSGSFTSSPKSQRRRIM